MSMDRNRDLDRMIAQVGETIGNLTVLCAELRGLKSTADKTGPHWIKQVVKRLEDPDDLTAVEEVIRQEYVKSDACHAVERFLALKILLEARAWGAALGAVREDYPDLVQMVGEHDQHVRQQLAAKFVDDLGALGVKFVDDLGGQPITKEQAVARLRASAACVR